jgi:signal transduction histidine kinase
MTLLFVHAYTVPLTLPAADEVRRLGETLNAMLDRLHASFVRERRFVADASHELRTPLAVLKTELETALRQGGHTDEVRESLLAAAAEADHLAQLAQDLLLIARASEGGLPLRVEQTEVRELLDQTAQRFSDRARADSRAIRVEAPDGLRAELDPVRVRQALGNLLDNGLRYGGGDILLGARETDGCLEIDVSDNGAGFRGDLVDHAFERFARADPARTRGGGTGLGLAIVRAIAEAHHGSATIPSSGDGRTTVRLRIPSSWAGEAV